MKTFRSMAALLIALCLALCACCALADQALEGDANVDQRSYPSTAPFIHPPFYNVKLIVEVDGSGVITAVRDNGTGAAGSVQEGTEEFWANKNKPYFDAAVNGGRLDRFVGKTLEEVRAMDMTAGADAVAGATMVCAAAQEAVINALEGRAGKTFLPVEGSALPVENVEGRVVTLENALPGDFDLKVLDIRRGVRNEEIVPAERYTVETADGRVIITFDDAAEMKAGYYYVNVTDASGKYRSPSFEGGPAAAQAPYFIIDSGLSAGDIAFDGRAVTLASGSIADYLENIEHVLILAEGAEKPVEQAVVGHHGTVGSFIALDENGVLNADGVVRARNGSESPLFEAGTKYTVTVSAFGYPDLTFAYEKKDEASEAAAYALSVNEKGETVPTLTADDGAIDRGRQDVRASSDVIEIGTAQELAAISDDLAGHYVLTADIDLAGYENWTPIGAFVPGGGEEGEEPDMAAAFTGTFDGNGHTIRNLRVDQPEGWAVGLFGCAANARIGGFTLENASVDGMMMAAGVVGYTFCSTVSDVKLVNGTVTGHYSEMGAEGMYGGIAGAGMASLITGCTVQADIVIPDGTANAGIIGGGLEMTGVADCAATGTVTAGNNCYGIGGISGCGFAAEQFTSLTARDVVITAGDDCFWIGGITGYAGGFEDESLGMPVTAFTGCKADSVAITAGANCDGVSALVGAGFYREGLAEAYGVEAYAAPTVFTLTDCEAVNVTLNGEAL